MKTLLAITGTTGLGVLTMYILDPVTGRMRRAKARDQLTRFQRKAKDAASATARDLRNRAVGTLAEGRAKIFGETVDDTVLVERIRSKLGFLVRHPSFIDVRASEGRVTLSGPVLGDEVQQLVRGVAAVRGVQRMGRRKIAREESNHRLAPVGLHDSGLTLETILSPKRHLAYDYLVF
jgi:hyperosmotically inducible periplasmic protein